MSDLDLNIRSLRPKDCNARLKISIDYAAVRYRLKIKCHYSTGRNCVNGIYKPKF
jgi:hypothetical protein